MFNIGQRVTWQLPRETWRIYITPGGLLFLSDSDKAIPMQNLVSESLDAVGVVLCYKLYFLALVSMSTKI